jgi:hypothetical protein
MAPPQVVIAIVVIDHGIQWEVQGHCECQNGRVDVEALHMAARWLQDEADQAVPSRPPAKA